MSPLTPLVRIRRPVLATFFALASAAACSSDDEGGGGGGGSAGAGARGGEQTGQACEVADDCFPGVDGMALMGEPSCLDRVEGGYCTHLCETDADCCAVPGECKTDLRQVCSPFESTGMKFCFLGCEPADVEAADGGSDASDDATEFCRREAHVDFICRSSGGGAQNRKVCVPGGSNDGG